MAFLMTYPWRRLKYALDNYYIPVGNCDGCLRLHFLHYWGLVRSVWLTWDCHFLYLFLPYKAALNGVVQISLCPNASTPTKIDWLSFFSFRGMGDMKVFPNWFAGSLKCFKRIWNQVNLAPTLWNIVLGWGLGVGVLKELESDVPRTAWGGGGKNWLREKGKELASTEHILRLLSCSCHP